ncbi:MAG: choice-of-anchor D domain-containing protein [Bryobacteraceae bacterium]|nr:choice-of-anchor D domain-containing protein [Bryobacteraceae bacterium]MDW8378744.1 choice-of-anchor D domain-containing protein [Bryobacterales bacterium]
MTFVNCLAAVLSLAVAPALAQAPSPFNIRFQQGQNLLVLADGGTATLSADAVGVATTGTLSLTYRGASSAQITINSVELVGSLDFSLGGFAQSLPLTVTGGETVSAPVRYLPSSGNRASARLVISYTENRVTASVTLNLVGLAPDFAFSYTPPGGNAQPIVSGNPILFPQTPVDTTANAVFTIINRGSGPGVINSITASGAAFQLVGAPLPGTVVEGGRELRVGLAFTPRQTAPSTGSLTVELFNQRLSFPLEGSGASAQFLYEVIGERGAALVQPEQLISLPDAPVGERSSLNVRVTNAGNADGRIAVITVSGAGISLTDLPPLPVVLAPGNRFTFTLNFAPNQAGRVSGRLRIGNDQFDLSATGLGAVLSFAYVVSGVSTSVPNNGAVNFVPTAVGTSSSVTFQITNTGTAPGSVNSISISGTAAVFELANVPVLPVTLSPNQTVSFVVRFAPNLVGVASATLRVDTNSFSLNGAGTAPAPLPSYRFEGASGTQEPLQQPAVSLTLASGYPLTLNGTLTLAFNSEVFANDPAVQFATGGRTVNFTIPANTTRAIFANGAQQMRLQTGSVAGSIVLTPSFATEGGINLTPPNPLSLTLTVAPSAPRLLNVSLSGRTSTSLTLLVSGYATSRSVTTMELRFTPVSGENIGTTQLTLNVESAFLAWYQSQASQAFGSLFTATIPLTITGDIKNVATPADTIQSIAVTARNALGVSNSVSLALQ